MTWSSLERIWRRSMDQDGFVERIQYEGYGRVGIFPWHSDTAGSRSEADHHSSKWIREHDSRPLQDAGCQTGYRSYSPGDQIHQSRGRRRIDRRYQALSIKGWKLDVCNAVHATRSRICSLTNLAILELSVRYTRFSN